MEDTPLGQEEILAPPRAQMGQRSTTTWKAIQIEVLDRIRRGEWQPGQLIPTETELAAELHCARATINRALRELAEEGVLERRRKVGTRVSPNISQAETATECHVLAQIEALGMRPGWRLLNEHNVVPPADIAKRLMLLPDQTVRLVETLYLADDRPCCTATRYLNLSEAPGFRSSLLKQISLGEWLCRDLKVRRSQASVKAVVASTRQAELLGGGAGEPQLMLQTVYWKGARPVCVNQTFITPGCQLELIP